MAKLEEVLESWYRDHYSDWVLLDASYFFIYQLGKLLLVSLGSPYNLYCFFSKKERFVTTLNDPIYNRKKTILRTKPDWSREGF